MAKKTKAQIVDEMRRQAKRIRDRNYRFNLMSPERKRVAIARDTIEWIEAGKLVPAQEGYLTLDLDEGTNPLHPESVWDDDLSDFVSLRSSEDGKLGLRELFLETESCTVCGIGGAFVAAAIRANAATVCDMERQDNDEYMRTYLSQWFSINQLGLIEAAFELDSNHGSAHGAKNAHSVAQRASDFGYKYDDPEDRLVAIMQNIIENDGTFVV